MLSQVHLSSFIIFKKLKYGAFSVDHLEYVQQDGVDAFTTDPGPLNGSELKYLPHMIKAANIYVINWIIQDFYNKGIIIGPYIHVKYLQHHIRFLTWLEKKAQL